MLARTNAIRATARRLLEAGQVDCVIGYRAGTVPLRSQPYIATTPGEADQLVWNGFCGLNLATFASGRTDRVAVVAQGCVTRSLNGLLHENRVARERLYVIGVPCLGMLDLGKIAARFEDRTILAAEDDGDDLVVRGRDRNGDPFEARIPRRDVKRDNCLTCVQSTPVLPEGVPGELVADPVPNPGGDIDAVAAPWEKLDAAGRWAAFEDTFASCIRCYACRDACPLCYCTECFVDESRPQWVGKTLDAADVQTFHILRAFHCAGRCTDCGACETACPQGIRMRRLTSKLEKDVRALWGFAAGMDPEGEPPLAVYRPDDPEEHFK